MYRLQRKLLSQNFLHNRQLIKELVRSSSIGQTDTVLEIGAGQGIITTELLKVAAGIYGDESKAYDLYETERAEGKVYKVSGIKEGVEALKSILGKKSP